MAETQSNKLEQAPVFALNGVLWRLLHGCSGFSASLQVLAITPRSGDLSSSTAIVS